MSIDLPPVRYDHPYPSVIVRHVSPSEIARLCGGPSPALAWVSEAGGCQDWEGSTCIIYIRSPLPPRYKGERFVIRHETGHCNGWPADHPR